ncbi:MAG: dTDP-4-dehydrorhamnose reductase [bacterium]
MENRPSILVVGGTGQIGHELVRELAGLGPVIAPPRHDLDLLDAASTRDMLRRTMPTIVVNAAGFTAVDAAESERELAAAINADAPALLATECTRLGAALVHFSSDYIFDGAKRSPYVETDPRGPLNVYGETKLAGEHGVAAAGGMHLILRTSWIYGPRGRNFVSTMLRLAREREELSVVDDQVGAPTSAAAVAKAVTEILRSLVGAADFVDAFEAASGVYHMSAAGSTTWYDFARTILADDPASNEQVCRVIKPVKSTKYVTAAQRPAYSVLDNSKLAEEFGVRLSPWTEQWCAVAEQLRVNARRAS